MSQQILSRSITTLKGVGAATAVTLARLNIYTLRDLCFHLPLRYEDRTRLVPICALRLGEASLLEGVIISSQLQSGRRRSLVVQVQDDSGQLVLRFYNFSAWQQKSLLPNRRVRCFGELRHVYQGREMIHPEVNLNEAVAPLDSELTPVYPLCAGLGQTTMRRLIKHAMLLLVQDAEEGTSEALEELLPREILDRFSLSTVSKALCYLHAPPVDASLSLLHTGTHPAQHRLVFEELLAHHLSLKQLRTKLTQCEAPCLLPQVDLQRKFLQQLPFKLTQAQQRVVNDILNDIGNQIPMQRLLQGDVGSGKTLVAAIAMLRAVEAGYQGVLMVPTELLAEQHAQTLKSWFEPLNIAVDCLTAAVGSATKKSITERISTGEARVVVGTHAVFQAQVQFHRLGLVVVDEQHRFGVHQRLALREKGGVTGQLPHQLVMTATPIPRTLAMTAYADLDVSIIDELPPGRQPVKTVVMADERRDAIVERIAHACRDGQQAFWVCPIIDESDVLQCQAASTTAAWLTEKLPQMRVGLLHGRMTGNEKEVIMSAFRAADLTLLVATTVIEVGVDVPRATLMIIENSERLGLAQLHQLRGRIGRGGGESVCVLLYRAPLTDTGHARLSIMRETNDGFEIAQRDLQLRGPGEVLGTRQSGAMHMRIADLVRDQALIPDVAQGAELLTQHYPERIQPVIQRWLGERVDYGIA